MLIEFPVNVVIIYSIFSLFQFYQALHIKNFRGSSQTFLLVLNVFAFFGMLFTYGFPIYFAFLSEWYWVLVLFGLSFMLKNLFFAVEVRIKKPELTTYLSIAGFAVLPASAFILINLLPA